MITTGPWLIFAKHVRPTVSISQQRRGKAWKVTALGSLQSTASQQRRKAMTSSQPMQETAEVRARRWFKESQSLGEKLRRCQWYLEAIGEVTTLALAKELASIGLLKSLGPAVEGEDDATE
jgi:hypothetical protein